MVLVLHAADKDDREDIGSSVLIMYSRVSGKPDDPLASHFVRRTCTMFVLPARKPFIAASM